MSLVELARPGDHPDGEGQPAEHPAGRRLNPTSDDGAGSTPGTPGPGPESFEVKATSSRIGHVILSLLSVLSLVPVVWMYLTSLRPAGSLFSGGLFSAISLENYRTVFHQMAVFELFWHTAAMAALVASGQLVTSLLAAFAFARWEFRGRSVLFFAFVGSWLVPFQVTMLPNYVLLSNLGLLNSLGGVIIPQLSSAYAVILLRQHLKSFPTELLDAAEIDGRSSWATLWRVVVPNIAPSLAALGILLFISAWNEYFWPFLVFRNPAKSVLQLGIQPFLGGESLNYGALMAASGLACVPILLLYVVLQRRVVNAFVRSGLK
jgi:sn-glycerol 3-phosphate transport system permease protein